VTYLGSFDYFLAQGLLLLNDCSSERLMLTESLKSLVFKF
jgi:hypothetical protein